MYKEFLKPINNKKTNYAIKKWAKGLNRLNSKEDTQLTNKCVKRNSTSFVVKELQVKIKMRYHYPPVIRKAKIQDTELLERTQNKRNTHLLLIGM